MKNAKLKKLNFRKENFYVITYLCKKIILNFFQISKNMKLYKIEGRCGIQNSDVFDFLIVLIRLFCRRTHFHIFIGQVFQQNISTAKKDFSGDYFRLISFYSGSFHPSNSHFIWHYQQSIKFLSLPHIFGESFNFFCRNLHQFGKIFSPLDNVPN